MKTEIIINFFSVPRTTTDPKVVRALAGAGPIPATTEPATPEPELNIREAIRTRVAEPEPRIDLELAGSGPEWPPED